MKSHPFIASLLAVIMLAATPLFPASAAPDDGEDPASSVAAPHAHALRAPGASVQQGRQQINAWIRFNLSRAFDYRARGQAEGARFHFALALHALRDSVSPWANDENGDPAVTSSSISHHKSTAKGYWREQVEKDMELMFQREYVPQGDLLRMYGIDSKDGPIDRPNQLPRPSLQ